eukprot:g1226.t1
MAKAKEQKKPLPCCLVRIHRWWWSLSPHVRKRLLLMLFAGSCLIAWIVGTATMLRDAYTRMYIDPDTGVERLDEDVQQARGEGEEYSHAALVSALVGYVLGPLMLLYGYQIEPLVIVANALMSAGAGDVIESLQNAEDLNANVSNGRIIPNQIVELFTVLVTTFTISVTALKIPIFDTALKAGITAELAILTIIHQIPPQFDCICSFGTVKCSPVFESVLYQMENLCFWDWWFRFGVKWSVIFLAIAIAAQHESVISRINLALVAANLCCQAIFDTVLAVLPSYGSRVQPYRMMAMVMFSVFAYKWHWWMYQFDLRDAGEQHQHLIDEKAMEDLKIIPCLGPAARLAHYVGKVAMWPLRVCNAGVSQLRLGGQAEMIAEYIRNVGLDKISKANDLEKSVKSRSTFIAQRARIDTNDANARNLLSILNMFLLPFALTVLVGGSRALQSEYARFLDKDIFICAIFAAVLLLLIAALGCAGAATRSAGVLTTYVVLLGSCLLIQLAVAALLFSVDARMANHVDTGMGPGYYNDTRDAIDNYAQEATQKMRTEFRNLFRGANCSARDGNLPAPTPINCQEADALWFEDFVNTQCNYVNVTDVQALAELEVQASEAEKWGLSAHFSEEKLQAQEQNAAMQQCLVDNDAALGSAEGLFCTCRLAINHMVTSYNEPIGHGALVLAFIELMCIVCACVVMRTGDRVAAADKKITQAAAKQKKSIMEKKKTKTLI